MLRSEAKRIEVALRTLKVRGPDDISGAFAMIAHGRPDGLVVLQDSVTGANHQLIVDLAARARLPAIYQVRRFVDAGGFLSYGINTVRQYRLGAVYVDKILRGAKPGDLPIEQPTKFEMVINLKTAKALGLAIPQSMLLRADEVIQ